MSFHSSKWPPLRKKNNFRNYVILCLHIFLFGIIVAVKSISGIKSGYAIWFSPVNCPRGFSSLSCDNKNNNKLRCMKLLRWQQRALCQCACLNQIWKRILKNRLGSKKLECVFADMWSLTSICWTGQFNSRHLKNSGHCNFLYGEKYYVIMHKHSQAYLTKNNHMSLDALK